MSNPDDPVEVANPKKRRVINDGGPTLRDFPPRLLTIEQRELAIKRRLSVYHHPESVGQHVPPIVASSNPPSVEDDKRFVCPLRPRFDKLTVVLLENISPSSPLSVFNKLSPPIPLHCEALGGGTPSVTKKQTQSPALSPSILSLRTCSGRRAKSGTLRWAIIPRMSSTLLSLAPIKL